ncbi:MAG: heat-inducible transcription repressor HrcA [Candidatus Riflebacteria bacterium]|nr:heat-inducible transcription repressor HrcA [Candidatus Riflebacteria bacterium]
MAALTARQKQILDLSVSHFIKTAEPVASRTLVKMYKLTVGPATIRNEMADLEEMGFLEQPHTSAGRVPTDRGYRVYVDGLRDVNLSEMDRQHLRDLESKYLNIAEQLEETLEAALKILAEVTHMVGVAALPRLGESHIDKIQLLDVGHGRVLVVLVTCSGVVETHVVGIDTVVPQEKLDQVSRIFNENFSHSSIKDFVGSYLDVLKEIRLEYRNAVKSILEKFFENAWAGAAAAQSVFLEGATAVFKQPEFATLDRVREILTEFEYKEGILRVVSQVAGVQEVPTVRIGTETRHKVLKDLSVVVTSYTSPGLEHGAIGIIGPRRMDYPKVIAAVDYISKALTRVLMR